MQKQKKYSAEAHRSLVQRPGPGNCHGAGSAAAELWSEVDRASSSIQHMQTPRVQTLGLHPVKAQDNPVAAHT